MSKPIGRIRFEEDSGWFWESDAERDNWGWILALFPEGLIEEGVLDRDDISVRGHLLAKAPEMLDYIRDAVEAFRDLGGAAENGEPYTLKEMVGDGEGFVTTLHSRGLHILESLPADLETPPALPKIEKGTIVRALHVPRDTDDGDVERVGQLGEIGRVFGVERGKQYVQYHVEYFNSKVWNIYYPEEIGTSIEIVYQDLNE